MINYMLFKFLIIIYILLKILKYYNNYLELNKTYINYQRELNLTLYKKIQKKNKNRNIYFLYEKWRKSKNNLNINKFII